jgi:cobalt transporter subunit CbtB
LRNVIKAVGDDGEEKKMNTQVKTQPRVNTSTAQIVFAALIGLTVMIVAGHLQAATLHVAAHDTRHATGFPCH